MNIKHGLSLLMIALLTVGCTPNPPRDVIFNTGGATMSEIYRSSTARSVEQQVGFSNAPTADNEINDYTRDAGTEIDLLFPELENPRLVMFVFPHTSANGHPIPGYSTAFYLYETSEHFALPGEVIQ